MRGHDLKGVLEARHVTTVLRTAAERVADQLCADVYSAEAPPAYHEFVEEEAYQAMVDALASTRVADLAEYGEDRDLTEAVDYAMQRGLE